MTYKDADGDLITVSSDIELTELFSTAATLSPPVARVFLSSSVAPASAERGAPRTAPISSDDPERIGVLISRVSQLLTAVQSTDRAAMDIDKVPLDAPGAVASDAVPAGQPRKRLFSGLRPYIAAFPSGRAGFRKHVQTVSPEVKIAFKKLVRYIANSDNTWEIVSALKDNYPALRRWTEAELGNAGLPEQSKVDRFVADVEAALLPRLGEELNQRVVELSRLALADEGFVNILREMRGMDTMPWEEGYVPRIKKASRGIGAKAATDAPSVSKAAHNTAKDVANDATMETLRDTGATEQGTESGAPRKGVFAGLRPYLRAFPSGKPGFRKSAAAVSPEVKIEFKKTVRFVVKSPDRVKIVSALKNAFPILRQWIDTELEEEGLPGPDKVQEVVKEVESSLLAEAGEEATTKVTEFMRMALGDEGVVSMLRKIRGMGPMPWEEGFKLSSMTRSRGPHGLNDKDGPGSKERRFAWDSIAADTSVPPAPLTVGNRGPKVKFLHKVLTDLGYMNESMYGRRMGFYGPKTKDAVLQFQREHALNDVCDDGVYDSPTAKHLCDVVEGRSAGAQTEKGDDVVEPNVVQV